ncbi:MAG: helix-turn-helix transcriptional regulator [Gemmatimonadales bacterium]
MDALPPALVGHRGLRGRLLLELKRDQPLTAKELADRYGVSANAIRRHLKELETEGLVVYDREQRGQGAPVFVYQLTAIGEALFPKRYDEALTDVLSFLAESSGREEIRRIFEERFRAQADRLNVELGDATLEERVDAVVDLLSRQGFMAEWSVDAGQVRIAEHNCAVQAVAERFPEICAAEAEFLKAILGAAVERESYIPDGCNSCLYTIGSDEVAQAPREGGRPSEAV